jgi:hypothetical protein
MTSIGSIQVSKGSETTFKKHNATRKWLQQIGYIPLAGQAKSNGVAQCQRRLTLQ